MLKDPLDDRETPYTILGLDTEAPSAAAAPALESWSGTHAESGDVAQQAQEAARQLQAPKSRAAIDIWFYPETPAPAAVAPNAGAAMEDLLVVPALAPPDLEPDLLAPPPDSPTPDSPLAGAAPEELTGIDPIDNLRF